MKIYFGFKGRGRRYSGEDVYPFEILRKEVKGGRYSETRDYPGYNGTYRLRIVDEWCTFHKGYREIKKRPEIIARFFGDAK